MRKPRTASNYQDGITAASRSGLAEVLTTLGAYREAWWFRPILIARSDPS